MILIYFLFGYKKIRKVPTGVLARSPGFDVSFYYIHTEKYSPKKLCRKFSSRLLPFKFTVMIHNNNIFITDIAGFQCHAIQNRSKQKSKLFDR